MRKKKHKREKTIHLSKKKLNLTKDNSILYLRKYKKSES